LQVQRSAGQSQFSSAYFAKEHPYFPSKLQNCQHIMFVYR